MNRNPTASSKSPPGVRIVTATGCSSWSGPAARISMGSSVASVSGRSPATPSLTATIRTRVELLRMGSDIDMPSA